MKQPLASCVALLLAGPAVALASSSAEQLEFFEKRIRPVLAEKCFRCHAADSEKLKGGLQVDHLEHLLRGGDTGPVVVPGKPAESLLLESIRYENEDLKMPPKEKLDAGIVADFERWIADGAVWPDEALPERGGGKAFDLQERYEEHWSWRPVEKPEPPPVKRKEWPRTDLDRFVLARIEAADLRPAEPAGDGAWLRRAWFDLVGLPPTPEAIEAFLEDESPDRRERVVDGLLASPHFGEKWARHWMDLVRFADTYGHEFDYPIEYAHEYRDYLIRAFNADVPYDQFVKEHIAGDLLEEPRRHPEEKFDESVLGTAFWYFHEATHAPTDVLANEADIMDNQIDVFGKAFQGLTVSCARCHDHKFDAISTKDYYALTAYLHSSARQEVPMDVGREREKTRAKLEEKKSAVDEAMTFPAPAIERVAPGEGDIVLADFAGGRIPEGWSTSGVAFAGTGTKPGIRFDESRPLTVPGTVDSGVFGKEQVGILRSPTFTIEAENIHVLLEGAGVDVRLIIDNYQMATKFSQLLFKGTTIKKVDTEGKFHWFSLKGDVKKYIGHRAYLEFVDRGDGYVILDEVRQSPDSKAPPLPVRPDPGALPAEQLAVVKEGAALAAKLPAPRFAVAMAEGTGENARVYVRGLPRNLGAEVPPRYLEALGGETGSRLALAGEVANPGNPLTARVYVNRLWHHVFGRGLVRTVDDFGPMGELPSHPELLDWLAAEFVENGWSTKRAIRQLVLSATYAQSSESHPEVSPGHFAGVDPENRLLSRMPVRRLTGEAIRDSILAVSGRLDRALYGPPVPTHRTEFMTGRGGRKSGPLDGDGRRTIYGATYRNFLSPFLLTFDVPSPFGPKGRRSVSNVPAQALVLMNDPFVIEQSRVWAERIVAGEGDDTERLREMFLAAIGREPSAEEQARILDYLERETSAGTAELDRWADLGHVVLNMKEFLFLQ